MADFIGLDDLIAACRVSIWKYPTHKLEFLIAREVVLKANDLGHQTGLNEEITMRRHPNPTGGGPTFPPQPDDGKERDSRAFLIRALVLYFEQEALARSVST